MHIYFNRTFIYLTLCLKYSNRTIKIYFNNESWISEGFLYHESNNNSRLTSGFGTYSSDMIITNKKYCSYSKHYICMYICIMITIMNVFCISSLSYLSIGCLMLLALSFTYHLLLNCVFLQHLMS